MKKRVSDSSGPAPVLENTVMTSPSATAKSAAQGATPPQGFVKEVNPFLSSTCKVPPGPLYLTVTLVGFTPKASGI